MINLSALNENELARIYLVANTPSYLYRHYRSDQSVQEVSNQNSAMDLLLFARQIAQLPNRTLRQVIQAYAGLVALTLKDVEVRIDDRNSLQGLDWGEAILSLGSNNQVSTSQIQLSSLPKLTRPAEASAVPSYYLPIKAN